MITLIMLSKTQNETKAIILIKISINLRHRSVKIELIAVNHMVF